MTTVADRETGAASKLKVIGTRPIRHDGLEKVTGLARYGADIHLPQMLHAKMLRSPHAHARIRSIDTSKAEALPGVKAVLTAKDFPIIQSTKAIDFGETMANSRMLAENIMATEKALYVGHAIAAVAATDPNVAEEAVKLIEVDYEVLEPVLDVRKAMKEDAPLLHDTMTTFFKVERFERGENTGKRGNIAGHLQFKRGDPEQGFREADVIVEREFTTTMVHQGYIEPHASTAYWAPDGNITVWTSTQGMFSIRSATAALCGVPEGTVKVIPLEIGGGFGGKLGTYLDPVVTLLSKKSGRPVKMVMSRKEVLEATGPTSGTYMRCKIGAKNDGRMVAAELYLAYEAGAFPGSPYGGGAVAGLGPYDIDNQLTDAFDVVLNKPKVQAYRAPGMPQSNFAVEIVVDELAQKLNIDPMDLRLKNVVVEGDRQPSGLVYPRIGCQEVEEAMKSHPHYSAPLGGPNRGRGVSIGFRQNGGNRSSAVVIVNADGTVSVVTGSIDIGGSRATSAMAAAEVLGLRAEDVRPSVADTNGISFSGATGGSHTTYDTTLAVANAAEDVKQQMMRRAAILWETKAGDVEFEDGSFVSKSNSGNRFSFAELASKLMQTGGPVFASAINDNNAVGPIFGGHMVDVEVDPETGKVDVIRCTAFADVGKALHPDYVEGQIQGGTSQGIGWALNEEYFFDKNGRMLNSSLLDYRTPTSLDLPMLDTVMIEVANPQHRWGVRGVGEIPIVTPMSAVANAVSAAIGVRIAQLPITPGVVLEAIERKKAGGNGASPTA